MLKKYLSILLTVGLVLNLLVGCSEKTEDNNLSESTNETATETTNETTSKNDEKVKISWFQFQIEVAEQVKALAKAYEEEHPNVEIDVEVIGDGYFDILRARIASGETPDIFMTKGYNYLDLYGEYIEDLSSQPFADNIVASAKPCITKDDNIYGLPVQMSGWGVIYNKEIFEKLGLKIPTTKSELIEVCDTLEKNGITPFVNQFKDTWLLGQFIGTGVGSFDNPQKFIGDMLKDEVTFNDSPEMIRNIEFLDLVLEHGQDASLEGDWNYACTAMGLEEAAMILEGIWVYDTIASINPDIELGMFPVPYTDQSEDSKIYSDVNGVWNVYNGSENKEVALDILNWITSSKAGQQFVLDCSFIPAYEGFDANINSVGQDIMKYNSEGKSNIWGWLLYPSGFETESGSIYQEYIVNDYSHEQTLDSLTSKWLELSN